MKKNEIMSATRLETAAYQTAADIADTINSRGEYKATVAYSNHWGCPHYNVWLVATDDRIAEINKAVR